LLCISLIDLIFGGDGENEKVEINSKMAFMQGIRSHS